MPRDRRRYRRRPRRSRRGSRVWVVGAILAVLALGAVSSLPSRHETSPGKPKARAQAARAGMAAHSAAPETPLPLRRIAERPGGERVLEAIEASGGWEAWARHRSVAWRMEGAFFNENGSLGARRIEHGTQTLAFPPRVRIASGDSLADSTAMVGFGPAGGWGAGRLPDGRWSRTAGPGLLRSSELARLALESAWFFSLPFNLGDGEVRFAGEPELAPGDTLYRLVVTYPPAPGDTTTRVYRLGLDPDSGHILEVFFKARGNEEAPADNEPAAAAMAGQPAGESDAAEPAANARPAGSFYLMSLRGYTDFDGIWRPTRRILYEADAAGRAGRPLYQQILTEVAWDPPPAGDAFEPPAP